MKIGCALCKHENGGGLISFPFSTASSEDVWVEDIRSVEGF